MSASCCTREIATTIMAESHPGARPLTTTAVSGSRGMRCHASCECCSGYCNIFHILLFSPSNPRAVSETYWANHALPSPSRCAGNQPRSSVPLGLLELGSVPVRGSCDDRHCSINR